MLITKKDLINALWAMGFRKIEISCEEQPGTAGITISGFGRFRKLEPGAVAMIQREKPIGVRVKIKRKFFGFKLWEIEI